MSIHLYIAPVGLAKCNPRVRLTGLVTLALVYTVWNRRGGLLFFVGAAQAQYDAIVDPHPRVVAREQKEASAAPKNDQLPGSRTTQPRRTRHAALSRRVFHLFVYIFALHLMSYPVDGWKKPAPCFAWANSFIPKFCSRKEKFPKSIGDLLFMTLLHTSNHNPIGSTPTASLWHRLFTSRSARYLGQNMLAWYLVHGTVLRVVRYGIPHLVWRVILGQQGAVRWFAGVVVECGTT